MKKVSDLYEKVLGEVSKVIVGKKELKESLILTLLAGGHILIEGPAGSAKTKLASTFARAIGGTFKRIQLTPDMMPADITGFYLYSPTGSSSLVEGPIFANVVLADELNRTTPRTQAALLEAMQERQVTIERKTYPLGRPFMVIATQMRIGAEGTYILSEVQVDRFLLRVLSTYSTAEEEQEVLSNIDQIDRADIQVVTNPEEVIEIQELVKHVHVAPAVNEYIISLVSNLRSNPDITAGPSTRASIALLKCARVLALFDGRDYVIPDDIKHLACRAVEHRIQVKPEADIDGVTPQMLVQRALEQVPVPKI